MATRKTSKPSRARRGKSGDADQLAMMAAPDPNITDVGSAELLKRLMLAYASSVNTDRAFVDWRDGLKPVGRRVLFALSKFHRKVKSANVVGDAMGGYHPHGDCLRGNTLVPLLNGKTTTIRRLAESGAGSLWVLAYDERKRDYVPAKAHAWRVGQVTHRMFRVRLSTGESLEMTANHPILTERGWVRAEDLTVGDALVGGTLIQDTYRHVATRTGRRTLHSIVGGATNGALADDEVYHHRDEDRHNNNPSNLEVLTRAEHSIELTWGEYEDAALSQAGGNASKVLYAQPEHVRTRLGVSSPYEAMQAIPPEHLCLVSDVREVILPESEPFYDFTVEGHANMIVCPPGRLRGRRDQTFVVAHNSAIYGALVTLVNNGVSPAVGIGNWGTPTDGCAAQRYTEVLMSEFGKAFFLPAYIHKEVTPYVDNYDGSRKEPLVLPALLPNVFFNGTASIGVGMAARLPTFTPTSVLDVMVSVLDGQGFDAVRWAKTLQFHEPWGGHLIRSRENMQAFVAFLKDPKGKGSLQFVMDHEVNEGNKTLILRGFIPVGNNESLINRIRELDVVRSVSAEGGKHTTVVRFVSGLNAEQFDRAIGKIKKLLTVRQSFAVTVLDREPIDVNNPQAVRNKMLADDDFIVNFHSVSVPKLMGMWLKWRIQLEVSSLNWRIAQLDARLGVLELLITAASNRKVVNAALDSDNPAAYLAKAFKWTLEQANTLLDRQIRQLSRLDANKFRAQVAETKRTRADLVRRLRNPKKEVRDFLAGARDAFAPEVAPMGKRGFMLKRKIATLIAGVDDDPSTDESDGPSEPEAVPE